MTVSRDRAITRAQAIRAIETNPRQSANLRCMWENYVDWCEANDVPAVPTGMPGVPSPEDVLLVFLGWLRERRSLRAVSLDGYARTVAQHHLAAGHRDPRSVDVRAYLSEQRLLDVGEGEPLIDALTLQQLKAIARLADGSAGHRSLQRGTHRLRAIITVADVFGLGLFEPATLRAMHALPADAFRVVSDGISIAVEGERQLLLRSQHPIGVDAVTHLMGSDTTGHPLAPQPGELFVTSAGRSSRLERRSGQKDPIDSDLARLVTAWARCDPRAVPRRGRPQRDDARAAWTRRSRSDVAWLVRHADQIFAHRLRDATWFLTGTATGSRWADREHLRIDDLTVQECGYSYVVWDKGSKLRAREGAAVTGRTCHLRHIEPRGQPCPDYCPVCLLDLWLEWRRRCGVDEHEYLFVAADGRSPMPYALANEIIDRIELVVAPLSLAQDGSRQRLGTRSMRITAVTLGLQAGLTPEQVAEHYTGHQSIGMVMRYDRRLNTSERVTLTLNWPTPPAEPYDP